MTPARTRYRERAALLESDLAGDQAYQIAIRRRHNIGQHGWGIVAGLGIEPTAAGPQVQAGFAIDGYGRELIVPAPILIPDNTFAQLGPLVEVIDVWLVYARDPVSPRGGANCGPWPRYQERALLRVEPASDSRPIDAREPVLVPEDHYNFGPYETPPDDPAVIWPVFLGRVKRTPADLAPYAVLEQPLPYITLRGELVVSPAAHGPQPQPATTPAAGQNGAAEPDQAKPPSNRVRMQIGAELATDRRRFAVSLPDTSGAYVDRLAIKADGSALLGGPTTLRNDLDLTIAGAAEFRPLKAPPKAAAPWQVYHVKTTKDGVESHELRVEIANPGKQGDPANTIFVVGGVQANQFKAALRVAADGKVTIGTLMVRGQVVEQPIDADPNDPRFGAKLAAQLSQGLPIQSNIKIEIVALANGVPLTDPTKNVAVGAALTYKVKLTNTTTTQMTEVQVYANQRIASFNKLALTPLHGQPRTLRPGESFEIDDSNLAKLTVPPVPNDTNQDIQLVISAVGRAGAQGSAFGSATSVVHIVEK